jgi:hypothetical protein
MMIDEQEQGIEQVLEQLEQEDSMFVEGIEQMLMEEEVLTKKVKGSKKEKQVVEQVEQVEQVTEPEVKERGWITKKILELNDKGLSRSEITKEMSKLLGRNVKYQQIFQTLKNREMKRRKML